MDRVTIDPATMPPAEASRHTDIERTLNRILSLSLMGAPVESILQLTLSEILSIDWLCYDSRGAILLTDEHDPSMLNMVVSSGLPVTVTEQCSSVPFGTCLCGRAAAMGESLYAPEVDERHDITTGEQPHGHYCVPITHDDTVLGVINLYIRDGHERCASEEALLGSVADVLAGVLERSHSRRLLAESEGRLAAILDAFDGLLYLVSSDYRIEFMNDQFRDLVGADVTGELCYAAIHGLEAPCESCPNDQVLAGETIRFEKRLKQDGRDYIVVNKPFAHPDGRVAKLSMAVDITDRKKAETALELSNARNRSLLRLYRSLGEAKTFEEVLTSTSEEIARELGYPNTWMGILSEDLSQANLLDFHGPFIDKVKQLMQVDERFMVDIGGEKFLTVPVAGDPLMEEIVEAGHTVVVEDARIDPRTNKEIVAFLENRTIINLPLMLADRPLGVLGLGTFGHEGVHPPEQSELDYLSALGHHVAVAMDRVRFLHEREEAQAELAAMYTNLGNLYSGVVEALSGTTSVRDPYTAIHQERVARLACAIADEMGLSIGLIEGLWIAGKLHDIGKIAVPTMILSKPGTLSDMEMGIVRTHATASYSLLEHVPFEQPVAETVLQHHERLDGSGYPDGLHGDEILLEAKILAVADVVEAMASHRPYRPALGVDVALEEIRAGAGTRFDAGIVDACVRVVEAGTFVL